MAMTKAEACQHWTNYHNYLVKAREAITANQVVDAIRTAVMAFPSIDGMLVYARKWEGRPPATAELIEIVLYYAPLVFDRESLADLQSLLKGSRRVRNSQSDDLQTRVDRAVELVPKLRRLWDEIERFDGAGQSDICSRLEGDVRTWQSAINAWENIGVVSAEPRGGQLVIRLCTRMDLSAWGKCPSCGGRRLASKEALLSPMGCHICQRVVTHVLSPSARAASEN